MLWEMAILLCIVIKESVDEFGMAGQGKDAEKVLNGLARLRKERLVELENGFVCAFSNCRAS